MSDDLIRRVESARNFPYNTTPESRHVVMIGRHLFEDRKSFFIEDDPKHCGEAMLLTVADFWETKTKVDHLVRIIRNIINSEDNKVTRSLSIERAVAYLNHHCTEETDSGELL